MKKLLQRTMLLLFALIAGSTSMWADDYSYDFSSGGTYNSTADPVTNTWETNYFTILQEKGTSNTNVANYLTAPRWYKSHLITITPATNVTITQIVINCGSTNTGQDITASTGSVSKSGNNSTWTGSVTSAAPLVLTMGSQCRPSSIDVTYSVAGSTPTCAKPTISGNTSFLTSTDVTISCSTDGATIQYSTDGGTNWTDYSAAFSLTETTTVQAKATKSGMTDSDVASKTFTKVTPITVAAAIAAINALTDNGTKADQCVAGKISQIDSYNSTYKSITYWISDDGTTTNQMEVYSGKGLNGADFNALTDLNIGDEVTVYGTVKKYVNSTTTIPEFIQNSQLLSYSNTGTAAPIITASNVTIDSEATSGEITYTIDNATTATLTAAKKSGDWISNVTVDAINNKVTFTTTVNDGNQRIGYITLSYTDAADKDVKITQKATYGTASLPFAFDGGKADIANTAGLIHSGLDSDYDYSPKLKFNSVDDYLILKINDAAEVVNFDVKGTGTNTQDWDGAFKVQTSADGINYVDLQTYTDLTSVVSRKSVALTSSVRYIKWIYTTKTVGNVGLGRIGVNCEAVTIPAAGYATFNTPSKIDFAGTTDVKAYKVSAVGATSVTIEEIDVAPANTPVILEAAAGTYGLKLAGSAADVTGNLLQVSNGNATTDASNIVYALQEEA